MSDLEESLNIGSDYLRIETDPIQSVSPIHKGNIDERLSETYEWLHKKFQINTLVFGFSHYLVTMVYDANRSVQFELQSTHDHKLDGKKVIGRGDRVTRTVIRRLASISYSQVTHVPYQTLHGLFRLNPLPLVQNKVPSSSSLNLTDQSSIGR